MKLNSNYLNPFQPFPERELDNQGRDVTRSAIEDNLSRSVFSALANSESPTVLATFLEFLVQKHRSFKLQTLIKKLAEILRNTDSSKVEIGLQTWPASAMHELVNLKVVLIGIASSHEKTWTYNQRPAPKDPRPDSWIYVPGQMLLVFEWKNDAHSLDATQISAYAHFLKLLTEEDGVPHAAAGMSLSVEEAKKVQERCADLVLDVTWDAVANALQESKGDQDDLGRWLCNKAAEYVRWHIRPPYRGIQTILEWLNGPDTPDRRNHLRSLVGKLGDELKNSAGENPNAITFAKDKNEKWDFCPGAGSAVYIKLKGKGLQRDWLGRQVDPVLWFQFAEQENQQENQRIGLEYYIQASGSHSRAGNDLIAWNNASEKHLKSAEPLEESLANWISKAPSTSQVIVSRVRFKGKKRNWQGGGESDKDFLDSAIITPGEALEYLCNQRDELWCFPRVELASGIEEAALRVRKPALSLLVPLEAKKLASFHGDRLDLQNLLQDVLILSFR